MKDRFNARVPVNEDPEVKAVAALHVKEIAEEDYEAEVVKSALPVALHFYGAESKACETLSPRFAAVAQKFSGKVRFLKVLRDASAARLEARREREPDRAVPLRRERDRGAAHRR